MRSGDYTTEALSGFLDDIISFFAFFIGLLGCHVTSQYFCGSIECFIVRVNDHLGQYRTDCPVDPTVQKLFSDAVLQVIANIALAHGGTHRHGGSGIIIMGFAEFIHGSVDHADLRRIAVRNGNLVSFFD